MNCRQFHERLDALLIDEPSEARDAELAGHAEGCPSCAREYELAVEALATIRLSHEFRASPGLKERIMSAMSDVLVMKPEPTPMRSPAIKGWRPALAVGLAAAVLIAVAVLLRPGPDGNGPVRLPAFSLLAQAAAAEDSLFAGEGIVHLQSEIVVKPIADPERAKSRWYPLVSLEATGKLRFHQLNLSAEPGKGYTVEDHAWYDPASGRLVRVLTTNETPIYANTFDGKFVYWLEVGSDGSRRVTKRAIAKDFQPPTSPGDLLGIAAGVRYPDEEKLKKQFVDVSEVGEVTLSDGTKARVVKRASPPCFEWQEKRPYWLYTIRADDNTIAQTELVADEESVYVVRRVKAERVDAPAVAWDLAGIEGRPDSSQPSPKPHLTPDMVVLNVSVEHMIAKADFETYLFSSGPAWAGEREIMDLLDLPSPPHRMFAIAYRAEDGRHVVLVQSHTYNRLLGQLTQISRLVYTSPQGVKVWSTIRDQWLAGTLLHSAQASIKDPPSEERTGYLLETPAKTFPVLAINGRVTDDELHALIDSLVPASQCVKPSEP